MLPSSYGAISGLYEWSTNPAFQLTNEAPSMIIAERTLTCHMESTSYTVPIRLSGPEQADHGWKCQYSIGWPSGEYLSAGWGVDAFQALWLTLQKIGADIYCSSYHEAGQLRWTSSPGYGFPVARNLRDLLVGDDARYDG